MQQRIAIVLAVIAAALVALLVWLPRALDVPSEIAAKPAASEDVAPRAAESIVAQPSTETPPLIDQRSAVVQAAPAQPARDARLKQPGQPSADFDASVIVHCVSKATRQRLAGIHVTLSKKDNPRGSMWVNGAHARLGQTPTTDADGTVEVDVPSGCMLHLFANAGKQDASDANQEVAALAAHERRTIVLELTVGEDIHFYGIVRALADDRPIVGARVSLLRAEGFGTIEGEGYSASEATLRETTSGADGRFELTAASWTHPFVRIAADGFALAIVSPSIGHDTAERAQVILLDMGAAIEATVLDERAAPIEKAEVVAWTEGYRLHDRSTLMDVDFGGAINHARWTGATGVDGRCTLKDVTAHVPLTLLVKRDGKLVQTLGSKVQLEAGEVRPMRFQIGAGCRVSGSLVDEKGQAIASQSVWRMRASYPQRHYLLTFEKERVDGKATTDADGKFAFDDVTAGPWWIGPAPAERGQAIDGLAPMADVVTVEPGAREMTITLRSQRGLYIQGRVLDSKGEPARRPSISTRSERMYWNLPSTTSDDGSFALGPVVDGTFELIAQASDGIDAPSDPVTVRAGDKDAILRLRGGGGIEGKVIDAATGEGCRAECVCISTSDNGAGVGNFSASNSNGSIQWSGLEPGSYELSARTSDGRTARARGVVVNASEKTSGIVLALELGAKLRLRYDGDQFPAWGGVSSDGMGVAFDTLVKGHASVLIVPKGKLTVTLRHKAGVSVCTREIEVAAGEEKEVVLTDEK